MKNYTKKRVTIQAVQYIDNIDEIIEFVGAENIVVDAGIRQIKTLEGNHNLTERDYVIKGVKGEFYPCKEDIFLMTYDSDELITNSTPEKTLNNTTSSQAKDNVKDIEFWGDADTFQLICKASSKNEGWMKSTKAMQIEGHGCVVQVSTQQRNPDGSYSIAEALTFVPNTRIIGFVEEGKGVINRNIVLR